MSRTRTVVVATVVAAALVGGGAVAGAATINASASSAGTSDSVDMLAYDTALTALGDDPVATGSGDRLSGLRDRFGQHPRFGRAADRLLHAELVVKGKDGQPITVAAQRGEVTAVDATSVTVKSEDGYTRTYALTDDTIYRSGREKASLADVTVGATVRLAGPVSGGNATAKVVGIKPAGDATDGASWDGGGTSLGGSSPTPLPSTGAVTISSIS
jgi:hypothetical protein